MKRMTFTIVIVATVAAGIAVWFWALRPLGFASYLSSTTATDADIIRQYWPHRLVQPEWISAAPDGRERLMKWHFYEAFARLSVVSVLWFMIAGGSVYRFATTHYPTPHKIMKQTNSLTLPLLVLAILSVLTGCSGIRRMDTVRDSIDRGYISGLSSSNQFRAVVWSTPHMTSGPYTKIDSLPVMIESGAPNAGEYAFFFGKNADTKKWEVFSCMKWQTNHWEFVPVTLPPQGAK